MAVTIQEPINSYIGNGSTTIFPYTFRISKFTDLKVYVDNELLTTGYSVSGVNNESGGNVIFTNAPFNLSPIKLKRETSLDRSTDYLTSGPFEAETLDNDIDRVVMMVQDLDSFVKSIDSAVSWDEIYGRPTTLSGFGITDAASSTHNHDSNYAHIVHNHDSDYADIAHDHTGVYQPVGSYLTGNETITLSGDITGSGTTAITATLNTVPISKGGTGQTTATDALNAFLPSQTGQAGQFLQTNGTSVNWISGSNNVEFFDSTGASKPIALQGVTSGNSLILADSLTFGTSAEIFTGDSNYGWRDIISDIQIKGTGANNPAWGLIRDGIYGYTFSASTMQEAWVNFHINHDYAVGTPIYLHAHWVNPGTNTGTVRWGFEYTIAKGHQQEIFPATNTVYVEQAAGGQYMHMIAEIDTGISSASLEPDALVLVRVFRDASHVNDTCTNAVALIMSDVHYQASKWATKNKQPDFNV